MNGKSRWPTCKNEYRFAALQQDMAALPLKIKLWLDRSVMAAHIGTMLIETETTPNPSTLKFMPGRAVMDMGTRDFATPEEADASPLAEALLRWAMSRACSSVAISFR